MGGVPSNMLEAGVGRGGGVERDLVDECLQNFCCVSKTGLQMGAARCGVIDITDLVDGTQAPGEPRPPKGKWNLLTKVKDDADKDLLDRAQDTVATLRKVVEPHEEKPRRPRYKAKEVQEDDDEEGFFEDIFDDIMDVFEEDAPDFKGDPKKECFFGDPIVHPPSAFDDLNHPLGGCVRPFGGEHRQGDGVERENEEAQQLFKRKQDMNFIDCVRKGKFKQVVDLVDNGCNAFVRSNRGQTMLMLAATSKNEGCVPIMDFLHELKCGLEDVDKDGWTPLLYAVGTDNGPAVRFLLDLKAEINRSSENTEGITPLILGIREQNLKLAKHLFRCKADLKRRDKKGWTPIMTACFQNDLEIVKWLLMRRAHHSDVSTDGMTPLLICAQNGFVDCAYELLNWQASVDEKNDVSNETPLTMALKEVQTKFANFILDPWGTTVGASVFITDERDMAPFDIAHESKMWVVRDRIFTIQRAELDKIAKAAQKEMEKRRNAAAGIA